MHTCVFSARRPSRGSLYATIPLIRAVRTLNDFDDCEYPLSVLQPDGRLL